MSNFGIHIEQIKRVIRMNNSFGRSCKPSIIKKAEEGQGEHWVTVNGRHIMIDGEGNVKYGGKGMADGKDLEDVDTTSKETSTEKNDEGQTKEEWFKHFFETETKTSRGFASDTGSFDVLVSGEDRNSLESDIYSKDDIGVYKPQGESGEKKYVWKPAKKE